MISINNYKFVNNINEQEENNINIDEIEFAIMDLFKNNKNPEDSVVHALAQKLNINEHQFEEYLYNLFGSFLGEGRFNNSNYDINKIDSEQLKMGIEVEMEHTSNPKIAKRIALDHLAELPDYYTRLKKMEEDGLKELGIKE